MARHQRERAHELAEAALDAVADDSAADRASDGVADSGVVEAVWPGAQGEDAVSRGPGCVAIAHQRLEVAPPPQAFSAMDRGAGAGGAASDVECSRCARLGAALAHGRAARPSGARARGRDGA